MEFHSCTVDSSVHVLDLNRIQMNKEPMQTLGTGLTKPRCSEIVCIQLLQELVNCGILVNGSVCLMWSLLWISILPRQSSKQRYPGHSRGQPDQLWSLVIFLLRQALRKHEAPSVLCLGYPVCSQSYYLRRNIKLLCVEPALSN